MAGTLITNEGKKIFLDRTYNSAPTRSEVTKFKIGVGSANSVGDATNPSVTDTAMENQVPITGTEQIDDADATTGWADSADCTLSVNTTSFKQGTGSLNITKDGTASVDCSSEKTTTSLDITGGKSVSIWLFIINQAALDKLNTTDAFTIRLGSDSSNYFEWIKQKTFFTQGAFNIIRNLTKANATSTVGTPVETALDFTFVRLKSDVVGTTWSAADFLFDDIKLESTDDFLKVFEAGFPTLDFSTLQAEIRGRVNTTEGNGYPLRETGIFNTDSAEKLESRDTFNAINKTNVDELIFIWKNRIT